MDTSESSQHKNFSYSWLIGIGMLLVLMVLMGIVNNCYSLFIIPVTTSLGFSRSQYSICQSLIYLFCMLGSANCWRIYKRFGLLATIRTACVILVIAYFFYSQAATLPVFYLISCIVGLCMGLTTTAAAPILLRGWFREKYGLALGIAMMGSGIGGMVFNPLAELLMTRSSWRVAYMGLAAIMACIAFPVIFFIFRENTGSPGTQHMEAAASSADARDPACDRVGRSRKIGMMGMILIFSIAATTFIYTLTPYLQDIGYSGKFASMCASASMAVLAVGKIVQGVLLDKLSLRSCSKLAFGFTLLGLVSLVAFWHPVMLFPVFLGVFMGCPYGTVAIPALAASISADEEIQNENTSHFTAVVNLGAAISPALAGFAFDLTSSYVPLFVGTAISVCLCFGLLRWLFYHTDRDTSPRSPCL